MTGTDNNGQQNNADQGQEQIPQIPREEERNTHGSLLIYLGMILISLTLLFCWWCRLVFLHLYFLIIFFFVLLI